jgi:hypothetical protein
VVVVCALIVVPIAMLRLILKLWTIVGMADCGSVMEGPTLFLPNSPSMFLSHILPIRQQMRPSSRFHYGYDKEIII